MWILYAFASAFFAGLTSVLAKCGIRKTDSTVATAVRTAVVLVMAVLMSALTGSLDTLSEVQTKTWLFLILSGTATGASWLCYYKALQLGDINKVVPVDKSSTILTVILACIFLAEWRTWSHAEYVLKPLCILLIAVGTFLMIRRTKSAARAAKGRGWLFYALLSAAFAALTAILGKIGIDGVESNLGTAIRTAVVLVMAWGMVFLTGKHRTRADPPKKELGFIILSGLATGASWLCYYKALQGGPASIVVPIDKLSILVTIAFSYIIFKEKLTGKAVLGLILIVFGTLGMLIQ